MVFEPVGHWSSRVKRRLPVLFLMLFAACRSATAAGVLSIGGLPPERAIVLAPWAPESAADASGPAMRQRIHGLIEALDPAATKRLAACGAARVERATGAACLALVLSRGGDRTLIMVTREAGGLLVASNASGASQRLRPGSLEALIADWGAYRGGYAEDEGAAGRGLVVELEQPLSPSPLALNASTLGKRFFAGGGSPPAARRVLQNERMLVRLPRAYSPIRPAGLIVWASPTDRGEPPARYHAIADEMNFVLAGAANVGNERPLAERLQLALDVVQTVRERFHIARERIYITGLSGGGKVSTILWSGASDVFFGAIPIAGTGHWEETPARGGVRWPRLFGRPDAAALTVLKSHRLAQVTGSEDFNRESVMDYTRAMEADGLAVRLFDVEGMGHELPPEASLRDAIRWVDEPWRSNDEARATAAQTAWKSYTRRFGAVAPATDEARAALNDIVKAGPWTRESWDALELLEAPAQPK